MVEPKKRAATQRTILDIIPNFIYSYTHNNRLSEVLPFTQTIVYQLFIKFT